MNSLDEQRVTIGNYIALAFAILFFSGLFQSAEWYGVFDFTTLNGTFGSIMDGGSFRGTGGDGARDGFIFALTIVPTCMFAMGVINVLEHFGALRAARTLLTPLMRPLMGLPGISALAFIGSLQNVDIGSSMTKELLDRGELTDDEGSIFTAFQFIGGGMLVNFFSSGAVMFTLTNPDGSIAAPTSLGLAIMVIFVLKILGANMMRLYLKMMGNKYSVPVMMQGQVA
ncbi:membrane protein [Endozoicomonas montiporae]|uniref:Membrane protein n=2 Tax=Endozoicomonas montiporae TaxID=1027273 RepID=A0A081NCB6_9GAMM|nr:nucleoside recognition domain-containing protein [Endozoicomonas montiporae]AMO56421.1 membrane protein [Endozoicomonas montiporae CL-33]KEQ16089.1 membrane protein [Endozoicomonas montiporae]